MTAAIVIVAAGVGERLGRADGQPKALVEVDGRSLLHHALTRVTEVVGVAAIVVAHTPGHAASFAEVVAGRATLVEGGATRGASVRAAVAACPADVDVIAVHDAARAFTPTEVIERTIAAITGEVIAAAPGLPVADTLKRAPGGEVGATVDRADLWGVQTPQAIRTDVFRAALAYDRDDLATDDLGVVERARDAGVVTGRIVLVAGDERAMKVTYPADLTAAERLVP